MIKKTAVCIFSAAAVAAVSTFLSAAEQNIPPRAENVAISTAERISVSGSVPVYDSNSDPVRAIVTSAPLKGEIKFKNGAEYTYTPFAGETGKDSFSCVFTDSKGAVGNSITGSITIEPRIKTVYADSKSSRSNYSALKLCENGVMTAQKIGDTYLFRPGERVKNSELLLMTLAALGEKDFPVCVNTRLENDPDIPLWLKPAVMRAKQLGIIKSPRFYPDRVPTRAKAAVYINRAAKIDDVKSSSIAFKDGYNVPKYAAQAYINLSAYKMLDLYDNKAHPLQPLKRSTAADMVWQLYKLKNKQAVK